MTVKPVTEIVFVARSVGNYQELLGGGKPGVRAIELNPLRDGVSQISEVLRQYREISTIHIVAHGSAGCLFLGPTPLDAVSFSYYEQSLKSWFGDRSQRDRLRLCLYGCNVAANTVGMQFLTMLHRATGATVYASSTLVGAARLEEQ